jgi:hypothetical protein
MKVIRHYYEFINLNIREMDLNLQPVIMYNNTCFREDHFTIINDPEAGYFFPRADCNIISPVTCIVVTI